MCGCKASICHDSQVSYELRKNVSLIIWEDKPTSPDEATRTVAYLESEWLNNTTALMALSEDATRVLPDCPRLADLQPQAGRAGSFATTSSVRVTPGRSQSSGDRDERLGGFRGRLAAVAPPPGPQGGVEEAPAHHKCLAVVTGSGGPDSGRKEAAALMPAMRTLTSEVRSG